MRFFRSTTLIFLIVLANTLLGNHSPQKYLRGKIPSSNKRYSTFVQAFELLEQRRAKTIVETGTARMGADNCLGDGCSTLIFADWAKDHDAIVYSVDVNPVSIACAKSALDPEQNSVCFIESDSIVFLQEFQQPIDFLYLDSYGFDIQNPLPSQKHHLAEIQAAMPWLTENTIVMIDDCDLPHGGKGKLVIEFLAQNGWKVIRQNYQVILVRE